MSTSARSTSSLSPSSVPSGAPQQASIAASAARCSSSVRIGRMSMVISSELRHGQCIDAVILRMCPDELHEGDLPAEIESGYQAIVSSRDLEPHTLAVQHLGFRSGFLDLIRGTPLRRSHELVPAFKRDLSFRVPAPEVDKHVSSTDPHGLNVACSHNGNKRVGRNKRSALRHLTGGFPQTDWFA